MTKKQTVKEDAAGGSTGAGAIAVAAPRLGDMRKRGSLKHFLNKFYSRVTNRVKMYPVMPPIKEAYDLSDIVSRLKGVEGMQDSDDNHVTFGVEDDEGNVMKVSVKREQAKEFEFKMARAMADEKDGSMSGTKSKMSLAELLYDLKDEFDIVDVEFPEIPKDVIYNADKATSAPEQQNVAPDAGDDEIGDDDMDQQNPNGMDAGMGGEDDMGMDADTGSGDTGDMGDSADGSDLDGDGTPDDMEGGEDDGMTDDESVEDFQDEPQAATPESILQAVMDMLKADADAKKAQADAAAEEARAKQAEYSYKASQATVAHQEELAQMQADVDAQKGKEKEAKQLANLAKHRVQKASMVGESLLAQVITELASAESDSDSSADTVSSLTRQKNELTKQWAVLPADDPDTANYKKQRLQASLQEIDAKIKGLKIKTAWLARNAQKQQQQAATASSAAGSGAGV